ncbi:MAG: mechanosensitive ion channel domain-containing protein [Pirellulales bacterium]
MLAWQRFSLYIAASMLAASLAADAAAQSFLIGPSQASPAASEPQVPTEPTVDKRAENAEQLRLALRKLEANGSSDTAAAQQVAYHQTLDAVLAQQQTVEQQIRELEARKAELDSQLKTPPDESKQAAFSFLELDGLKDELAAERVRATLINDKLTAANAALEKAQRASEESDKKLRQAQEAFEIAKDAPNSGELAAAADNARQASRLARETVTLRDREVDREDLAQEVQRLAVRVCQERVTRMSPLVVFSEADYQAQIDDIAKKEESAKKLLSSREASLQSVFVQIHEAEQQFAAESGDRTLLTEKLAAHRRAHEKLSDEIDSLTQRLQRLAQLRVAWSRRFQIASANLTAADQQAWNQWKDWQKETKGALDDLAAALRSQILRMRDLRSTLTSISKKADAAENGPQDLLWLLDKQKGQVEAMLKIRERDMVSIETSRRVNEKLLEEIGLGTQALTPKMLAFGAWHQLEWVWKYEILPLDEKKSITVGKIVTGLSLFAGGWIVSRFLSVVFAYRLLKRFRLSKDGTAAIRTLVFYILLAIVALVALKTVNVPLTAFTILGGALAIGVGFGSQALINNFIGGLIMLAERPVRLGETITFGKHEGVVEDVGFRCTKLRTSTDHLVTIPNSILVNESIENVARRRTIRRTMDITITYDTPREKIAAAVQAIRDILEEKDIRERIHPIVGFEEFPPRVFFNDFNAESLNIRVVYWYAPTDGWAYMEHSERVNYRIMEEFARLGVEFAFPSRTVYVKHAADQTALEPSPLSSPARAARLAS